MSDILKLRNGLAERASLLRRAVARAAKSKNARRGGLLLFTAIFLLTGTLTPVHDIKAASCVLQGNTISVSCEFAPGTYFYAGTLTIEVGVTVTMQGDTGTGTGVTLVADDFVINGTIEADTDGYAGGTTTADDGDGPGGGDSQSGFAKGASHGGRGSSANSLGEYGSAYAPILLGSGGGDDGESCNGGAGGGAFKLFVAGTGAVTFGNGAVLTADAQNATGADCGGGAGGSIWIDATDGSVTIAATHTASVGAVGGRTATSNGGGAGGGGRIAMIAGTCTNCGNIAFDARGGAQGEQSGAFPEGGAGSIFLRLNGAPNGDLIYDNNNFSGGEETSLVASSTNIVDNLIVRDGADLWIPNGFRMELASGGTLTGGGTQPRMAIFSGGAFDSSSSTFFIDDLDILQRGEIDGVTDLVLKDMEYQVDADTAIFPAQGDGRLDDLTLLTGAIYESEATTAFHVENLVAESGSTLRHIDNTTAELYKLYISATSTIDLQSGVTVDVSARGYIGGQTNGTDGSGPGGGLASGFAGGGGYGGEGGHNLSNGDPYGSLTQPFDNGSGGGHDGQAVGGDGGGAVRLSVQSGGTISIDTTINVNGGGVSNSEDSGGGSGGSIWIDAVGATVEGTGSLSANGANAGLPSQGGGGGAGGRVALHAATNTFALSSINAAGGSAGSQSTSTVKEGGAGTIYVKLDGQANGDLIVDNNNRTAANETFIESDFTFDAITVREGSKLDITSPNTLTLASGGTLTGGGTSQPTFRILAGGTFVPPSASFTFNDIDVTHNGDMATVTSLGVTAAAYTFTSTGDFTAGGGVTSLTLSSAASFTHSGGTNLNLTSLAVPSGTSFTMANEDYHPFDPGFGALTVNGTYTSSRLATLFLDSLTVPSGGSVTHTANAASKLYVVDVSATSSIDVQTGGTINVDAKGFAEQQGPGAGATDDNEGGGGGYGGNGGETGGADGGAAYGSVSDPNDLGSGGGHDNNDGVAGGAGGGLVRLASIAGTITVNGTIEADGAQALGGTTTEAGGGSGGGIYISADTVAGTGSLRVFGGASQPSGNGAGGGGGRIAVYYANGDPLTDWSFTIGGGANGSSGGSQEDGGGGTLYTKDNDDALPKLRVSGNDYAAIAKTPQVGTTETYGSITITAAADYEIGSGETLALGSGGTLTGGGTVQPVLTTLNGGTFDTGTATFTFDDIDVTNGGAIATVTALTVDAGTFNHAATGSFSAGGGVTSLSLTGGAVFNHNGGANLTLASLTVPSDAEFYLKNENYYPFAENFGALSVSGRFSTDRFARLFMDSLTVASGGIVTHASNTSSIQYRVDMSATTSINVQTGGFINVDQRGYAAQNGPGKGETHANSTAGGGAYGGDGGSVGGGGDGGETYGFIERPEDAGSGGGDDTLDGGQQGGAGGGIARLIVGSGGTITVNGTVSANGEIGKDSGDGGGGAGGSIWIDAATNTIAGTGTVRANGARCATTQACGGGGGGRIAIYYTSGNPNSWTKTAYGGQGGNQGGTIGRQGGAGTIFVKSAAEEDGDLIVDNNNLTTSKFTRLTGIFTQRFKNIIIRNGSCFRIPNAFRLRKAAAGLFTFGGSTRPCLQVDSGGKLDPGSGTFDPDGLDIDASGELEGVSNMTITDGSIDNTLTFGGGCASLTLGSGGNLNFVDSATFTCSAVTVQSGGTVTHTGNSSSLVAKILLSANSLDLQSGGSITASNGGFDAATGTGAGTTGTQGGGGGHGGAGGQGSGGQAGGATYGDSTWPETMGSGGGDDTTNTSDTGGAGGGVIKIVISSTGTLTVNGTLAADGEDAAVNERGGGAGGSILIETGTWAGTTGCISADGGDASGSGAAGGGGGGGGRIAVYYTVKTYTGCGLSVTGGAKGGTGAATAGATGSFVEEQSGSGPVNGSVTINPTNPEVGQNVVFSATSTDDDGVAKIEIYLDGTGPGNLVKTCLFSPVETPATCQHAAGSFTAGSHSVTVVSYDEFDATDSDTTNFSVAGRTATNSLDLSRTKVGETATVALTFTLSATSTGTLELTFPSAFTVTSAPTSGSSCLSSFGFTSTTMTATKTGCTGSVTMTGGTVVNPSVAGTYTITWTNDNGSAIVVIVDDDAFNISASVDPVLTFNVGSQAAISACDGTFAGFGGTIGLGTLTTSAVGSSDVSSVPHICTRLSTNAPGGAVVTVQSQNASLASTSSPGDTIPSNTTLLAAGTAGYGLCGGSLGSHSGRDTTTPTGAAPTRVAPFNDLCDTSGHRVGALTSSPQTVWSVSDPTQNAFVRIFIKAAISGSTLPHDDYADTLTFIATATY